MKDLSVIILSFNTRDTTLKCLTSLESSLGSFNSLRSEVIVVDNASSDNTPVALSSHVKIPGIEYKFYFLNKNLGFTKGNNYGASKSEGKFILFLNSDVIIENVDWGTLLEKFSDFNNLGALTVKVNLPSGSIDLASHRGVPTLWNSICYFLGLEKISKKLNLFKAQLGGYHLIHLDLDKEHEVDAISGAFFLMPKRIFDNLNGFDEDYFMYGEDLDLAFRLKKIGYKILYDPSNTVTHLKYQSGKKGSTEGRKIAKYNFYKSMLIFYNKNLKSRYPTMISWLINIFFKFFLKKYI